MATSALLLPNTLILLVHLHILEYPHANKPEYDHDIFDPRIRGLRERVKLLEDISYFLVGRLEGNSRTILPTYPCLTPSDMLAFRTSLTKYLEMIRHNSMYPNSKAAVGLNGKSKGNAAIKDNKTVAWWWKDVPIRKSLLEECAGDRFERLLLSVSTHVLLKSISPSAVIASDDYHALLRSQPIRYANLLAKCKSIRQGWSHSASLLLRCQEDLKSLRRHLESNDGVVASKYSSLSTQRLLALAGSRQQDLLCHIWRGQGGRLAFDFVIKVSRLHITSGSAPSSDRSWVLPIPNSKHPAALPQPLPIAAAHHPANLKKLRKPVFSSVKNKPSTGAQDSAIGATSIHTSRSLSETADTLDSELSIRQALTEALARIRKVGQDLIIRVKALEEKCNTRIVNSSVEVLDLWQPEYEAHPLSINFYSKPTPELFSALSLNTPDKDAGIDSQIDHIREVMLPPYPPIPDLSAPRVREPEQLDLTLRPHNTESLKFSHMKLKSNQATQSSRRTMLPTPTLERSSTLPSTTVTHAPSTMKYTTKRPKKSLRLSLAINSRPSFLAQDTNSENEDLLDCDVHEIVSETQDTSIEDPRLPTTPKTKPPNRIFTGAKSSVIKRHPVALHSPSMALPSFVSPSSSFDNLITDDDDDEWASQDPDGVNPDVDGLYYDDAPSMTLCDILLQSGTGQYNLLGDELNDIGHASFQWE